MVALCHIFEICNDFIINEFDHYWQIIVKISLILTNVYIELVQNHETRMKVKYNYYKFIIEDVLMIFVFIPTRFQLVYES